MKSPWRPLLTGDLAAQALQAVDEIAAALDSYGSGSPDQESRSASLAGGTAGQALLRAYLHLHTG